MHTSYAGGPGSRSGTMWFPQVPPGATLEYRARSRPRALKILITITIIIINYSFILGKLTYISESLLVQLNANSTELFS